MAIQHVLNFYLTFHILIILNITDFHTNSYLTMYYKELDIWDSRLSRIYQLKNKFINTFTLHILLCLAALNVITTQVH